MIVVTQEWGPVPDGYDHLEPLRSATPCVVIRTETGGYLALYRVEWHQEGHETAWTERRLVKPQELGL